MTTLTPLAILLTVTAMITGADIPIASADAPTPTVNNCSSGPQTQSSEMTVLCDNTLRVDKITWSSWTPTRAAGRGIQFLVVCEPNCATGTPVYTPVAITLDGAAAPQFRFTSATITSLNTGEVHTYPTGG